MYWPLDVLFAPLPTGVVAHMIETGLISARIKDLQGRAEALRGYL